MPESFISSIKQELKICVLLRTFLKVKSLLRVIISYVLFEIFSKVIFLLEITVFLVRIACFTGSIYVKDVNIKGIWIIGTCVGRTCIKDAYIHDSIFAKYAYTGVISNKYACVRSVCASERSEIHLQSFQILEIRGIR